MLLRLHRNVLSFCHSRWSHYPEINGHKINYYFNCDVIQIRSIIEQAHMYMCININSIQCTELNPRFGIGGGVIDSLTSHYYYEFFCTKNYVWTGLLSTLECNYRNAHEYDMWFLAHIARAGQNKCVTHRLSLS